MDSLWSLYHFFTGSAAHRDSPHEALPQILPPSSLPPVLLWEPDLPESKLPSQSWVTMTEVVLPSHCDVRGYCLGGIVLSWIDIAAGISAKRHCVTRSVDAVHFIGPITTQSIVIVQASVNRAWKTSCEVGVRVVTESLLTGQQQNVCHAYMTFVALPGTPAPAPAPAPASVDPPQSTPSTAATNSSLSPSSSSSTSTPASRAALSPAVRRSVSFSKPASKSAKPASAAAATTSSSSPLPPSNEPIRKPIQLPAITPVSKIEQERFRMAQIRRQARLLQSTVPAPDEGALEELRSRMRKWNFSSIAKSHHHPHVSGSTPPTPYGETGGKTIEGQKEQQEPQPIEMQSTFAEAAQLVLPQHANSLNITFGGQIIRWMENVCAVSASRLARVPIVTASIDSLQFHRPTYVGDCVTIRSVVTRVFGSSMEVYAFVDSENLMTGKQTFTNEAYFTMVAISGDLIQTPLAMIPPAFPLPPHVPATHIHLPVLRPTTEGEEKIFMAAEQRREERLDQRRQLIAAIKSKELEALQSANHAEEPSL